MKPPLILLSVDFIVILLPLLFLLGLSMIYAYRKTQKKPVENAKQLRIKSKHDDDLAMLNQQAIDQMNQQTINQINQQIIQQQHLPPNS